MAKKKTKKNKEPVRFHMVDLIQIENKSDIKFTVNYYRGIPHIALRQGQREQIGYLIVQSIEEEASEREKDRLIYSHTRTYRTPVTLETRPVFFIKDSLCQMQLESRDDCRHYFRELARIILESKGKSEVHLPDVYSDRETPKSAFRPKPVNNPDYGITYANKRLEAQLLEI